MPYNNVDNRKKNPILGQCMFIRTAAFLKGLALLPPTQTLVLFSPVFERLIQQREHVKDQAQIYTFAV